MNLEAKGKLAISLLSVRPLSSRALSPFLETKNAFPERTLKCGVAGSPCTWGCRLRAPALLHCPSQKHFFKVKMKNKDLKGNGGGEREFCLTVSCPPPPLSQRSSLPRRETPGRGWGGRLWYRFKFAELFLILFCLLATKWLIQST